MPDRIEMTQQLSNLAMDELRGLVRTRLDDTQDHIDGDFYLNEALRSDIIANATKPAAVLIGFVEREEGVQVILTKRTENLKNHSGQIAFPGGKIDAEDPSAEAAALREAWEEIGLDQNEVEVVGRLPDYHSGSGYLIAPVLGIVSSRADFEINHGEVEYMFEVPLAFLMDRNNHIRSSRMFRGLERHYYEMPWQGHYIWGVTAGMIRVLHDRVFDHETA